MTAPPSSVMSPALMARPPRDVLIVVTRRIGDVLLATPLIRSLKQSWPHTAIDALVFDGTQDILAVGAINEVFTYFQTSAGDEDPRQ